MALGRRGRRWPAATQPFFVEGPNRAFRGRQGQDRAQGHQSPGLYNRAVGVQLPLGQLEQLLLRLAAAVEQQQDQDTLANRN